MTPKVLVIIVTYNALQWIEKTIESLKASSVPTDIIIIDNCSTDNTNKYIAETYSDITFVQNATNLGFGQANNIGLKHAISLNYDYVYLLNQDAWIKKDTLEILIHTHQKHPEYGILSPIQVQANEQNMDNNFLKYVAPATIGKSLLNDIYFGNTDEVYEVNDVMAAHWLICKDCLMKVGGFSPAFHHYGEDNNYIDRARYHNFKVGIVPTAIGIHDRENRKDSFECKLKNLNLSTLIKINDITEKIDWWKIVKRYIQFTYKQKTLKHFRFAFQLVMNLGKILTYREQTTGDGAFLDTIMNK